MKVKVIEVEATKLDPNAQYLIVFSDYQLSKVQMRDIATQLGERNISAVLAHAPDPERALKIYQIPPNKKVKE